MGSFETFDHTADLGLRIEAESLEELFAAAAQALAAAIVANPDAVQPRREIATGLEAETLDELLIRWLNELIFLVETRSFICANAHVSIRTSEDRQVLSARLVGETIDPSRHDLDHEVKAATRHGAFVRREPDGTWSAEVIVDI